MAANTRFAVAVHAMVMLGYRGDEWSSSELIATSVNTHPVVIRRILSALSAAKLVESQSGKQGGSRLSRKPEKITLLDVYRSVEGEGPFALHRKPENRQCPVSSKMKSLLSNVLKCTERAMEDELRSTTIADLIRPIR